MGASHGAGATEGLSANGSSFSEPFPDGDVTDGTGTADDGTAVSHDSGTTRDSTFTLAGGESSTGPASNTAAFSCQCLSTSTGLTGPIEPGSLVTSTTSAGVAATALEGSDGARVEGDAAALGLRYFHGTSTRTTSSSARPSAPFEGLTCACAPCALRPGRPRAGSRSTLRQGQSYCQRRDVEKDIRANVSNTTRAKHSSGFTLDTLSLRSTRRRCHFA